MLGFARAERGRVRSGRNRGRPGGRRPHRGGRAMHASKSSPRRRLASRDGPGVLAFHPGDGGDWYIAVNAGEPYNFCDDMKRMVYRPPGPAAGERQSVAAMRELRLSSCPRAAPPNAFAFTPRSSPSCAALSRSRSYRLSISFVIRHRRPRAMAPGGSWCRRERRELSSVLSTARSRAADRRISSRSTGLGAPGGTIWKIQHLTTGGGLLCQECSGHVPAEQRQPLSRGTGPQFVPTASGFLNPFWRYDGVARKRHPTWDSATRTE